MLLSETGQSLIHHTWQAASSSKLANHVVVAADHPEIVAAVQHFGGTAMPTDPHHPSGTDRVAEIAREFPEFEIIVNVQGDEPELPGADIDLAISLLKTDPQLQMATLATPIRDRTRLDDPNCVKVVTDQAGRAMYFSRSPIPHPRAWDESLLTAPIPNFLQHIGLYAYRRDFLLTIPTLEKPEIEKIESLEQLRVLHAGIEIHVGLVESAVAGIDTAADYAAFVRRQAKR